MLALHYEEALRELLSDVAQWVGVSRWPSAAMVHQPKLAMLQRRTRRAWVAAVHACGTETDRGFTEDNLACSMYREAQSLPPIADQRNKYVSQPCASLKAVKIKPVRPTVFQPTPGLQFQVRPCTVCVF
jgi:hypothetical protein